MEESVTASPFEGIGLAHCLLLALICSLLVPLIYSLPSALKMVDFLWISRNWKSEIIQLKPLNENEKVENGKQGKKERWVSSFGHHITACHPVAYFYS